MVRLKGAGHFLLGALYLAAFAPALVIAAEPVIQRHCPKEGLQ
jgi:hypothetical protein